MQGAKLFGTLVLFFAVISCASRQQREEPKVVGVAILAPMQFPNRSTPIEGGRTSILWGMHDTVKGADLSLFGNSTEKEFHGAAFAVAFNSTKGKAQVDGVQMAGVINLNHGKTAMHGIQMAGLANYAGSTQETIGVQAAILGNIGKKNKVYGFQVGLYNEAEAIYGFQIGLINRTKNLYGIQIGALNFSSNNGLPFCPVLNVGF